MDGPEARIEWDPIAHATRWRDQLAIASKVDGTCTVRSSTNGDETDVQAAVGALFQPTGPRSVFQFRALALWTSWICAPGDRLQRRADQLYTRAGDEHEDGLIYKRKRVRWATFNRLMDKANAISQQADNDWVNHMARLFARLGVKPDDVF